MLQETARKFEEREERGHHGDAGAPVPVVRNVFFKRVRRCPLSEKGAPPVDYKNIRLLSRFISERGRIIPSRISSVSAKKQRELAQAIKRARMLGLLPFVIQ